jgi:hypothetical protein
MDDRGTLRMSRKELNRLSAAAWRSGWPCSIRSGSAGWRWSRPGTPRTDTTRRCEPGAGTAAHADQGRRARLSAVLAKIQADQRERDEELLASPKVNRRRKQHGRAPMRPWRRETGFAGARHPGLRPSCQAPAENSSTRHLYFAQNPTFLNRVDIEKGP